MLIDAELVESFLFYDRDLIYSFMATEPENKGQLRIAHWYDESDSNDKWLVIKAGPDTSEKLRAALRNDSTFSISTYIEQLQNIYAQYNPGNMVKLVTCVYANGEITEEIEDALIKDYVK